MHTKKKYLLQQPLLYYLRGQFDKTASLVKRVFYLQGPLQIYLGQIKKTFFYQKIVTLNVPYMYSCWYNISNKR